MNSQDTTAGDLTWVADRFVEDTAGVRAAVVLSADGLVLAKGGKISDTQAGRTAAVASGVFALAAGFARQVDLDAYEQSILRFAAGHLVITSMAKGAALAVVTEPDARLGVVASEMAGFAHRVGENFDLTPRKPMRATC